MSNIAGENALFWLAIMGPGLFLVIALILGAIEPNYDPLKNEISYLSLGKYGLWQTLNFVGCGLLIIGLGLILMRRSSASIQGATLATASIIVMGCVLILAAVFPTDPPQTTPLSTLGVIHLLDFMIGMGVMISAQLIVGKQNSGTPYGIYSLGSGVCALLCLILLLAVDDLAGLWQRLLVFIIMGWIIVTACCLATACENPLKSAISEGL